MTVSHQKHSIFCRFFCSVSVRGFSAIVVQECDSHSKQSRQATPWEGRRGLESGLAVHKLEFSRHERLSCCVEKWEPKSGTVGNQFSLLCTSGSLPRHSFPLSSCHWI